MLKKSLTRPLPPSNGLFAPGLISYFFFGGKVPEFVIMHYQRFLKISLRSELQKESLTRHERVGVVILPFRTFLDRHV